MKLIICVALIFPFLATAGEVPFSYQKVAFGDGGCSRGFYKSGNQCFKLSIPSNGKLNYLGNDWVCKSGFQKSGNRCLKVKVPKNAKLNYRGDGWSCKQGFYKLGDNCLTIKVPENAVLNNLGNGWVCTDGYKKRNNGCVVMSSAEVKKQKQRAEDLKKEANKKAYGNSCETEYRTHSKVCVEVSGDKFKCKKSFGAGFYRRCAVDLSYNFDTDYRGAASLDFDVICTVEVEYKGRNDTLTQVDSLTNDKSHSLDALGNGSGVIKFKFPFNSSKEVTSANMSSAECSIDNIDLY